MIKSGILTVYVSDLDRAVKFYSGVLGLSLKMHFPGHWAQVEAPGVSIGLHPASDKSPRPGHGESLIIGLTVENLEAAVDALKQKGVKFTSDIVDDVQIRFANFADPDGNPLYLSQLAQNW
jgi:predicted enzyme related to lactoylglutathione lyase